MDLAVHFNEPTEMAPLASRTSGWLRVELLLLWLLLGAFPCTLRAQLPPLKVTIPGFEGSSCPAPATSSAVQVAPEAEDEAVRLRSAASQAIVLGEPERARDLLARAAELDPASGALAYQYGRVLEDLGDVDAARSAYCRTLAVSPDGDEAADAQRRLAALAARQRPPVPQQAVDDFLEGVARADAEQWTAAADAFTRATDSAPEWPEAWFDRGVVFARLDRREAAAQDLRRYLDLRPDAIDARGVAELIGQLATPTGGPRAGVAFTLGLLVPGMGQFYSGRPAMGMAVLTLAGSAATAAFLVQEVKVRCLADVDPGAACPPSQVLDEQTQRPYLVAGLAVAGAVTLIGAIEAAVHASGHSTELALRSGNAAPRLALGAGVEAGGGGTLRLRFLRLRF